MQERGLQLQTPGGGSRSNQHSDHRLITLHNSPHSHTPLLLYLAMGLWGIFTCSATICFIMHRITGKCWETRAQPTKDSEGGLNTKQHAIITSLRSPNSGASAMGTDIVWRGCLPLRFWQVSNFIVCGQYISFGLVLHILLCFSFKKKDFAPK